VFPAAGCKSCEIPTWTDFVGTIHLPDPSIPLSPQELKFQRKKTLPYSGFEPDTFGVQVSIATNSTN
jgi:hypothetical protein